jgi:hypothetical protein
VLTTMLTWWVLLHQSLPHAAKLRGDGFGCATHLDLLKQSRLMAAPAAPAGVPDLEALRQRYKCVSQRVFDVAACLVVWLCGAVLRRWRAAAGRRRDVP